MNAEDRARRRLLVWGAAVLLLLPAFYWLQTGQVWEDFLITFRHSENLVHGQGLTYHEGTRVHGFTSPLNVLVPAVMLALSAAPDFTLPLLLTNLVTLACLALGGACVLRTCWPHTAAEARWTLWLWPVLLATCVRVSAYTVNGQEAGYWVLFLGVSFAASVGGLRAHWRWAGIGWAGLLWTRPDAPVHIALLALSAWLNPVARRRDEVAGWWRATLLGAAIYLPWLVWAWITYGSPVPHSAQAKVGAYAGVPLGLLDASAWLHLVTSSVSSPFLPIYAEGGGWPAWLHAGAVVLGVGAIAMGFAPDRVGRMAAVGFVGSIAYLGFMAVSATVFPWYSIPPLFFGTLAWCRGLALLSPLLRGRKLAVGAALALVLVVPGFGFAQSLRINRLQQELIENGVRRNIGLWLRDQMQPGDRVYLEPIGTIGYFSRATVLDYPGLVSPAVVNARREHGLDFITLIGHLEPEWVVLRARDLPYLKSHPELVEAYEARLELNAAAELIRHDIDPALSFLWFDAHYFVLQRVAPPPTRP